MLFTAELIVEVHRMDTVVAERSLIQNTRPRNKFAILAGALVIILGDLASSE